MVRISSILSTNIDKVLGAQIPSGLLYYTQNDEVIRVNAARNELRSLIQNRNRMVGYMMRRDTSTSSSSSACNFLPPTEDDERMCGKCYAVDGCMLYRKVCRYYSTLTLIN
jgi:DNA replication ATP-dependent helicase Dna2